MTAALTLGKTGWVSVRKSMAMTLLELVVVLVILAIVATVAVQALQPRVDNARGEATRRTLEQLANAIIGQREMRQTDGTPLLGGFVADIGRNPVIKTANSRNETENRISGETALDEFWNPECELAIRFPFAFRAGPKTPQDFSDVRLACGWRGPYLNLPVGAKGLRDGWGTALEYETGTSGEVVLARAVPPVSLVGEQPEIMLQGGRVEVSGSVVAEQTASGPELAEVRLLTPDPENTLDELFVHEDEDPDPQFFRFSNVPIGMRALVLTAGSGRLIRYVQVPHGGLSLVLELRPRSRSGNPAVTKDELP